MNSVPFKRNSQREALRSGRQKAIIVGGVPIPAGEDTLARGRAERGGFLRREEWHEIGGEPELVRALERTRFRDAFFDEVRLPDGIAVRLENFEAGLRAAGLVGVDEILVKTRGPRAKFRVAKRKIAIDGHLDTPSLDERLPVGNALNDRAVVTEGQARRRSPLRHSKSRF